MLIDIAVRNLHNLIFCAVEKWEKYLRFLIFFSSPARISRSKQAEKPNSSSAYAIKFFNYSRTLESGASKAHKVQSRWQEDRYRRHKTERRERARRELFMLIKLNIQTTVFADEPNHSIESIFRLHPRVLGREDELINK